MLCNHWYNLKSHLRLSNILYYVVGKGVVIIQSQ